VAPRLKERYANEILPRMREQFGYKNVMQAVKVEKVVVNMGVGDATQDLRLLETALTELGVITGQKGCIRKARRSISNFKLRAGAQVGCMVTLRGNRMYEFMDRLFNVAIPRIRDFRGISPRGFDKFGNFTLGLREQTIFPEINIDKITKVRGMNITFVIKNSKSPEESRELLRQLGMPFSN